MNLEGGKLNFKGQTREEFFNNYLKRDIVLWCINIPEYFYNGKPSNRKKSFMWKYIAVGFCLYF